MICIELSGPSLTAVGDIPMFYCHSVTGVLSEDSKECLNTWHTTLKWG